MDLLFLFAKRVPPDAENLIREMIYPLWDIGMDVGYATRSVKECLSLAAAELNILTPLLDARFICGMSMLFSDLMAQLRDNVIRKRRDRLMDQLLASTRSRHAQFGDSAYLLEPHLKEGQGGLRDYHAMLWMARLDTELRQPRDLEYLGLLSHSEYQQLWTALDFIWTVRNHLHHISGRKTDRLHFETQIRIAENLKYRGEAGQQPVERFLGELHGRMEDVKRQHLLLLHEFGLESRGRRRKPPPKTPVEGMEVVSWGMLGFSGPEAVLKRPELLVRIFEESALLKAPLSPEAKRLVGEFLYLVDADYRCAPEIVRAFERILKAPDADFSVLDDMHTTGFLEAFIPEFRSVSNRIQYDEYHLFPVDKHLLRTVQTIKQLAADGGDPLFARVYRELKGKAVLAWAALLHDVGKGDVDEDHAVRGAEVVRRILAEKGLTAAEVETAAFLVREHLFLIKTATRRDIHDEETAVACARRIMDPERLKMLYVLTVADSVATGPAAWNDWTSHLLRELFLKVLNVLERGELASEEAVAVVERKRAAVLGRGPIRFRAPGAGGPFPGLPAALPPLGPGRRHPGAHPALPAAGRAGVRLGHSAFCRGRDPDRDDLRQGPARPDRQHGRGVHVEPHQHPERPGLHVAQPGGAGRLRGHPAARRHLRGREVAPGRGPPGGRAVGHARSGRCPEGAHGRQPGGAAQGGQARPPRAGRQRDFQLLHHHRGVHVRLPRAALPRRRCPLPLRAGHFGGEDRDQGGPGGGRLLRARHQRSEGGHGRARVRRQGSGARVPAPPGVRARAAISAATAENRRKTP